MLAFLLALPAQAVTTQSGNGGGVRVEATYAWPERLGQGVYPLQVRLENSTEQQRELTLVLEQSYGYNASVERELVLEPGGSAELELLFPAFTEQAAGVSLRVEERGAWLATLSTIGPTERSSVASRQVLLVGPQALELEDELDWVERLSMADHLHLGATAFQDLPQHPAAFTSVDVVVLDTRDELPRGDQLDGLLGWVRLGGTLVVVGSPQGAASHPGFEPWLQDRFAWTPYLDGGLMPGMLTWTMGRGSVAFLPPEDLDHGLVLASRMRQSSDSPLHRLLPGGAGKHDAGFAPRIPGVDALPRGLFALLVLVVAFLLGPVNFLVVRFGLRRPALALLTTPVLALGSTGTLVGVGVAHNGLGVRAARATVTLLDQRQHRAATHEVRQLYAGLSPGKGLRPSAESWAFPTEIDWEFEYRASWDEGRVVAGDMLPVRVPTSHAVVSERSARQRLEVDGLSVSNSLGGTIEQLVVQQDGATWRLEAPLTPGGTATLVPAGDAQAHLEGIWASTTATQRASWPPKGHDLPERSYVARLDSSPFVESSGLSIREDLGEHWVIGILEEAP